MIWVCPSCRTVAAQAGLDLTERDLLGELREEVTRPCLGEYPRTVSWEESRRQSSVRAEEWGLSALGRLLSALGGAT